MIEVIVKFNYLFGMVLVLVGIFIVNSTPLLAISFAVLALIVNYKDVKQFFKEL